MKFPTFNSRYVKSDDIQFQYFQLLTDVTLGVLMKPTQKC